MRFWTEAEQQEQINRANGEARAILAVADAKAKSIEVIAKAIADAPVSLKLLILRLWQVLEGLMPNFVNI